MTYAIQAQLVALRREQILEAAAAVFAEKGYHAATVRDIAGHARLADGTLYNYFANKAALLLALLDRLRQRTLMALDIDALAALGPRDGLTTLFGVVLQPADAQHTALMRALLSEALIDAALRLQYREQVLAPTLAAAEPVLHRWMAAGLLRADQPELLMQALAALMLGLQFSALMDAPPASDPARLTDLLLAGMGGAP